MRRDDQANDHDDRCGRKYQDHREHVLEDPVLARYPLPVLQRHPGPGWMIAGGRIVQVESSAARPRRSAGSLRGPPIQTITPPCRPSAGSVAPCRLLEMIAAAAPWSSYLAARDDRARETPQFVQSFRGS